MKKSNNTYSTLEELYLCNKNLVFAYLWDYLYDIDIVGDMASEIWVKVAEREESFLLMDKKWVKNYLRIMSKNIACDYYRNLEKEQTAFEQASKLLELYDPWKAEEESLFYKEKLFFLEESIKALSKEEAELIMMRFKYNMSSRQIGELLGIKEGTVRVRQMRTIAKMKKRITALMREEDIDE